MTDKDNHREITIETLTTPPLQIQPAPLVRRLGANLLDSSVVCLSWVVITRGFLQLSFFDFSLASVTILFLDSFFYYFVFEWLFSITPGKRSMKLQVVGTDGDPCTMTKSALRNLFRIIDWIPIGYLFGVGLMLISDKKQRAGDRIAHTIVTLAPKRDNTPPPAPFLFH